MLYYNNWIILLNLYKNLLPFFKEDILTIPGNKFNNKGYTNDNPKLIKVSLIKWIWVFLYTAPKHPK